MKTFLCALLAFALLPWLGQAAPAPASLLNVSYDVTRGFHRDYNALFTKDWKEQHRQEVNVTMSHDGSTVQARRVLDGLDADEVTTNQDTDIDILADRGNLVAKDWRTKFPHRSVPYTSTILFMVRGGNPRGVKDWNDLVKPGVRLIIPNPKTSGNGRYSYLAAWAYAMKQSGGNDAMAKDFVARLFKNVVALDKGGRAATTTFAQRGIGDVLLTFENEVYTIKNDPTLGGDKQESVVPSLTIRAEPPIAIVEPNVDRHGTRGVADAHLRFLFTPAAQELAAKNFYRPVDPDVLARHGDVFKAVERVDVQTAFGGCAKAQKVHFDDGGLFDRIYSP